MSRVAVDSSSTSYGGMSRLPRPVGQGQLGSQLPRVQNGGSSGTRKPSRLEQMQVDYQKNIMKEKEQKLISLFEDNQQRALQKVNQGNNGKGMLRDFFQERRAMGSGNSLNHTQPSMENMYNRKKMENKTNPQSVGRAKSYNPGLTQKQSAGRDRSNLLAPISGQRKNVSPGNPFPNKAQIVRPRTYKDVSYNNPNRPVKNLPSSAPTGQMMIDSSDDDSPPPNPQQLQMLQQKRLMMKNRRNNQTAIPQPQQTTPKQTDFQKWQEDQNQSRSERLKKYRDVNVNVAQKHQHNIDDEGFDDDSVESDDVDVQEEINNKQALLLHQIEEQQRELERLKHEREREDIEDKKEKARRKKMEEERKRREKEEEERRRKQEDDERVKRSWEEEKARKMAEEKQRMRQTSHTSKYEYEDSAEEEEENFQFNKTYKKTSPPPQPQHKPSAPSKPKPTTTRKYQPPKSRTPPMPQGDHVALYKDADNMEGAFENVGKLVSCFNCGRKFAEDRVKKHEQFCKNVTKKRKVLDPSKLRTQGTEMAQYVGRKQNKPKPKKSNWRDQHESFMNAIKYAKKCKQIEEQGGSLADLPPPPRSENKDYVQCPHCTRRFNPQTAERHIPHCKNTRSRPAPPKRK